MNNKQIAKHAYNFIGGIPTVNRYNNQTKEKQIDIMCCRETKYADTNVYATIGLNEMDGGVISDGISVRIELISIALSNFEYMGNIISSVAYEIMDNGSFNYGDVIQNVVSAYVPDTQLKHVVLLSPVYWRDYAPLVEGNVSVSWLMLVPISDKEMEFIQANGIKAFETKLANSAFEILDLKRPSVI